MNKQIISALLILSLCTSLACSTNSSAKTLRLSHKTITLSKGNTCTLKVIGAKKKKSIVWKSSNKKIATVSKKGVVTAKKKGKATVTAKIKKQKLRCKITVLSKKPAGWNTQTAPEEPAATMVPAATQTPPAANAPAATQTPPAANTPAANAPTATQAPPLANTPAATQTPPAANAPTSTYNPWSFYFPFLWNPSGTQTPAATQAPAATKTPAATKAPAATKTPADSSSSSTVTEEKAYEILNSLRTTYPEGMTLTNSYYYYSPCFGNGYGCYGFAAKLSDTVFGTEKACSTHTSFDQIKVGDNIRIGNSHSVIVLTKTDNAITVVEGNYNSSVHWDRTITKASLSRDGFKVTTRY